jgi:hypothetical protein
MAMAVATGALSATFAAAEFSSVGEWRMGSGFWFPASVNVNLRGPEDRLSSSGNRTGNCTPKHL